MGRDTAFSVSSDDIVSTSASGSCGLADAFPDIGACERTTTLVVRNIPAEYTEDMVLEEWPVDLGYDFFYLPRSSKGKANLGYAFLNFASPAHAEAFIARWHKSRLARFHAAKRLNVGLAEVQGLKENIRLGCVGWAALGKSWGEGGSPEVQGGSPKTRPV